MNHFLSQFFGDVVAVSGLLLGLVAFIYAVCAYRFSVRTYYINNSFLFRFKSKFFLVNNGLLSEVENETALKILQLEFGRIRQVRTSNFGRILKYTGEGRKIVAPSGGNLVRHPSHKRHIFLVWRGASYWVTGKGFSAMKLKDDNGERISVGRVRFPKDRTSTAIDRYPRGKPITDKLFSAEYEW